MIMGRYIVALIGIGLVLVAIAAATGIIPLPFSAGTVTGSSSR
jgi:hypothetical protein